MFELDFGKVKMGKMIEFNNRKKEADVYFEDGEFRYIIEMKSWDSLNGRDGEIQDWYRKKYVFFTGWNQSKKEEKELKIYFIVAAKDRDALKEINGRYGDTCLTFYDQTLLYNLAVKYRQKGIKESLRYFIERNNVINSV